MTNPDDRTTIEQAVEELYVEHVEQLMIEADMAVRLGVVDKEDFYKRQRIGCQKLIEALRSTLTRIAEEARMDERERLLNRVSNYVEREVDPAHSSREWLWAHLKRFLSASELDAKDIRFDSSPTLKDKKPQ
jgi:hypothetical protein